LKTTTIHFFLEPQNNARLAILCGQHDKNLKQIENYFATEINCRGYEFTILGAKKDVTDAKKILEFLFAETIDKKHLSANDINMAIQDVVSKSNPASARILTIKTPKILIRPRTPNQIEYLRSLNQFDINFGIGPAGTGKTYLAVAYAVEALEKALINRIIITRPVVEAGERLGYLPGDIAQKVDPYLRPIYDALYEMLGFDKVTKMLESRMIEIAPLAFMRGRTLNDAMIILDEAQNTTIEQMKMFLTRLGFGSQAIITGDITQTDLPKNQMSGLHNALTILKNEPKIGFVNFQTEDIVRHPLVQKIVKAYEKYEQKK
jgi:phosphate starvation-inducible protein PhoH and related proteins